MTTITTKTAITLHCTITTMTTVSTRPALPRWLSGERVGFMTWWLWVRGSVEGNFLSGVFLPLASAEECEKSSRWLWKESCVSSVVRKPGNKCASLTTMIWHYVEVAFPTKPTRPIPILHPNSSLSKWFSFWNVTSHTILNMAPLCESIWNVHNNQGDKQTIAGKCLRNL